MKNRLKETVLSMIIVAGSLCAFDALSKMSEQAAYCLITKDPTTVVEKIANK